MTTTPQVIARSSDRRVAVHRLHEGSSGRTVLFLHSAPGAGLFDPGPRHTQRQDITLVAPDRPGYGGSDPMPEGEWATVVSAADDAAAYLDEFGGGPAGVAGWSEGGRVALALAARRPDLVDRVAVVATPAPDDEVQWIHDELRAGIDAMRGLPADTVHAALNEQLAGFAQLEPDSDAGLSAVGDPAVDSAALLDGGRDRLAGMLREAFRQGVVGLAQDIAGYTLQPFGFDPAAVAAETLLIYGGKDAEIGPPHGAWWQRALPNGRLEVVPESGHLVVVPAWERVLGHLAPTA